MYALGQNRLSRFQNAPGGWWPKTARRISTCLVSDIPVRGDDGARAIGATDDAAAVELPGRRRRHPGSKAALEGAMLLDLLGPPGLAGGASF
jgi:hypothetical protein